MRARLVMLVAGLGLALSACELSTGGLRPDSADASSSGAGSGGSGGGASSSASSGGGGGGLGTSSSASTSNSSASSSSSGGGTMIGASCADILKKSKMASNGVYMIDPDGPGGAPPFSAYCEMKADGGGWTLALKIDGNQSTFEWNAQIWKDDATYQEDQPALDHTEAKLPSFSTLPLTALRLGMEDGGMKRWIVVSVNKSSALSALVTSGDFTATNAGRGTWQQLVADPSLQVNCNAEGFNVNPGTVARVRIGILGNDANTCLTPDSLIGFGGDSGHGGPSGNYASFGGEHGDRNTKTFGYVMVR